MKTKILVIISLSALIGCAVDKTVEETPEATPLPTAQPTYACRTINFYDYTAPAPYALADDEESYFADVLMIGDSRMGGIALYAPIDDAEIYYTESVSLLTLETMVSNNDPKGRTLYQILDETTRGNIYILLGINEIRASNFDPYLEAYDEVIEMLREHNPDVNIYIILEYMSQYISGLTNEQMRNQINTLNEGLIALAQEDICYIIDLDEALAGENGEIIDDYTWDGLHMNTVGAGVARDYIMSHVVSGEDYVKKICE